PTEYPPLSLHDALPISPAGEKVNVSDIDYVPYAGVRLNAGGVYAREVVPAKEVKARTLTRITKGHIVYNRMWATKGSFGVVDEEDRKSTRLNSSHVKIS